MSIRYWYWTSHTGHSHYPGVKKSTLDWVFTFLYLFNYQMHYIGRLKQWKFGYIWSFTDGNKEVQGNINKQPST